MIGAISFPADKTREDQPMRFDQKSTLNFAIAFALGGGIALISAKYSAFIPVVTVLVLVSAAAAAMKRVERTIRR
jgi:hypothetical protein